MAPILPTRSTRGHAIVLEIVKQGLSACIEKTSSVQLPSCNRHFFKIDKAETRRILNSCEERQAVTGTRVPALYA